MWPERAPHSLWIRVVTAPRANQAELGFEVVDTESVKRCPALGVRTATVHETRRRWVRIPPSLGGPNRSGGVTAGLGSASSPVWFGDAFRGF